jgi:omega-6 fatty acid desaturase (delta-12 desaturase)
MPAFGFPKMPHGDMTQIEAPAPTPVAKNPYKREIAPYAQASVPRAVLDLLTSVAPYFALSALMVLMLNTWDLSYWAALPVGILAAGFLLRTYIVFHDCTHGSFLPSKRANSWLGIVLGLVVYSSFRSWAHDHRVHHASSGDLDRRGVGDVPTLTVTEYRARSCPRRLGYRLFRNPLVMFGLGPIFAMVIKPRLVPRSARMRIRRSVMATNAALAAIVGVLSWLVGWREYLLVWGPSALLAGSAGVWLFYVQHQFEDAYWQSSEGWSYVDAAIRGSSHLRLPRVLRFFTGNIGLHHVHHLSARIPNYNLQRAHDENPWLHGVPTLSLWDGLRTVRLKLWDEARGRMVTFPEARRSPASS